MSIFCLCQGLRTQMQGLFSSRMFIDNKQHVVDLHTEQNNGCETPKALSSITMLEESAAMKIIKNKNSLHSRRKTERAMKR